MLAILGRGSQLHRDLAQVLLLAQQKMLTIQDWEAEYLNALRAEEAKEARKAKGKQEESDLGEEEDDDYYTE